MFYKGNKMKSYQANILIGLVVFGLFGCGGEGEGEVEVEVESSFNDVTGQEAIVDYTPEPSKLLTKAETSTELYVEPTFSFDSYKSVSFDVSVTDNLNQPVNGVMLSISFIDMDVIEFDDPRLQDKSLLTKVFTNANGQIYITLEMAQSVSKFLLELNTLGVENDVIVTLDDTGTIVHSFKHN